MGTMIAANGDLYEGQWALDHKHGPGTYYLKRGRRLDGVWHEVSACRAPAKRVAASIAGVGVALRGLGGHRVPTAHCVCWGLATGCQPHTAWVGVAG